MKALTPGWSLGRGTTASSSVQLLITADFGTFLPPKRSDSVSCRSRPGTMTSDDLLQVRLSSAIIALWTSALPA